MNIKNLKNEPKRLKFSVTCNNLCLYLLFKTNWLLNFVNAVNVTMTWAIHIWVPPNLDQMRGWGMKSVYFSARIICWLHDWNKTHSVTYQRQIDGMPPASPEFLPWAKQRFLLSMERFSMLLIQRAQASDRCFTQHHLSMHFPHNTDMNNLLWKIALRGLWAKRVFYSYKGECCVVSEAVS